MLSSGARGQLAGPALPPEQLITVRDCPVDRAGEGAKHRREAIDPEWTAVRDYTDRFRRFLDDDVAPVRTLLAEAGVGTASLPRHDDDGRMHPVVWEARREVQRRAGAAGLYAPHIGTRFGGAVSPGWRCTTSRSLSTATPVWGWVWPRWPGPRVRARRASISDTARQQYLTPLVEGRMTAAFANTEPGVGSDVLAMTTHAERRGGDWVINGRKAWITNAHFADVIQVVAVTDPGTGDKILVDVPCRPGPRPVPSSRGHADHDG